MTKIRIDSAAISFAERRGLDTLKPSALRALANSDGVVELSALQALVQATKLDGDGTISAAESQRISAYLEQRRPLAAAVRGSSVVDVRVAARSAVDGQAPVQRGIAAEAPGPLQAERITFVVDGEARVGSIARHLVADDELVKAGRPGRAVDWIVDSHGVSNFFWESLNNRSDPALLRVHARFLELSDGARGKDIGRVRHAVQQLARATLTSGTGLNVKELAWFPHDTAVAVVKRLALAAKVPLADVVIADGAGTMSLNDFEAKPKPFRQPTSYRPLVECRTPAAWAAKERLDREAGLMAAWFDKNPHGALNDYAVERERLANDPSAGFWAVMEEMHRLADLAELAGRPRGGMGRASAGAPLKLSPPPAPVVAGPAPVVAAPAPSTSWLPPTTLTPWQLARHPSFAEYTQAKVYGFQGGFNDFISRR